MPVNDNKPKNPEDIVTEIFNSLLTGFGSATTNTATPKAPTVDPIAEANRLLKKAETEGPNGAAQLLQIADRHIKIIELALAYQK